MQFLIPSFLIYAFISLSQAATTPEKPAEQQLGNSYQPLAINFDIHRGSSLEDAARGNSPGFVKRDKYLQAKLVNEQSFYMANISVGTPGQNIGVLIDTGSSDLWIMNSSNPYCKSSNSGNSYSASKQVEERLRLLNQTSKEFKKNSKVFKDAVFAQKEAVVVRRDDANDDHTASSTAASGSTSTGGTTLATSVASIEAEGNNKNIFSQMQSLMSSAESAMGFTNGEVSTYTYQTKANGDGSASTGGSESYSVPSETDISSSQATMDCDYYGTFDDAASKSYHSNNTDFLIQYGDYTFASGTWAYDHLKMGNITVENFSFALANESNSTMGVFGIGLEGLESTSAGSSAANGESYTYENFPVKLVNEGIISRNVYSLYLNDVDATSGTILFGAIDHSKYSGQLQIVSLVNTLQSSGYKKAIKFEITASSISVASNYSKISAKTVTSTKYPALLDSGTTLTYLPPSLVKSLGKALGGTYSSSVGAYIVKCNVGKQDVNVTFDFTGAKIQVPLKNFLLQVSSGGYSSSDSSSDSDTPSSNIGSSGSGDPSDSSGSCAIGMISSGDNRLILGDSFLRAAYVVYDLDNYQLALAQANLNSNSQDIEVISASTVPNAVTAASYSSTYSGSISEATDSAESSDGSSGSGSGSNSNSGAIRVSGVSSFTAKIAIVISLATSLVICTL